MDFLYFDRQLKVFSEEGSDKVAAIMDTKKLVWLNKGPELEKEDVAQYLTFKPEP